MSDPNLPHEGKRSGSVSGNNPSGNATGNEATINSRIFKKASVDHFLRSMKSQVFEDDSGTITNATPGSSLVGPGFVLDKTASSNDEKTRRSSSWAFWQRNTSIADTTGDANSSTHTLGSNPTSPKLLPDQDNNDTNNNNRSTSPKSLPQQQQETELQLDKAAKVNLDVKEIVTESTDTSLGDKAVTWSFWNSLSANGSSIASNFTSKNQSATNGDSSASISNKTNHKRHKSNVVIQGEGAVLSEPSKVTVSGRKVSIADDGNTSGVIPEVDNNAASNAAKQQNGTGNKATRANLVVPNFEENIPYYSAGCRVNTLLQSTSRRLSMYKQHHDETLYYKKHLYRCESRSFKRALIIGVHGFFPTKMIRPLIGTPTGTSMRFAQEAETAVLNWAAEHRLEIDIQKIALEKEGKVFDRVEFFLEVMSKWKEDIERADFIFIAAHSQGTPVAIMLLSQLIERDFIGENKIVGILGMAGINLGPFFGADQTFFMKAYSAIENQSLLELFEFQNFESALSRKYVESLRILIRYGVKITYIGSVNDQLVPLYSAIASHVSHPNIFRGVYIDGSSNTPGFVTRVVKLACELQNLGRSDHGVIKQISNALTGPLTGGGHSRIYSDPNVYKTALSFILSTIPTDTFNAQPVVLDTFEIRKIGSNPYTLPWCVRGLFYEASKHLVHGDEELKLVLKEFDEWKPENKALKDVKYRLNGIKEIIY